MHIYNPTTSPYGRFSLLSSTFFTAFMFAQPFLAIAITLPRFCPDTTSVALWRDHLSLLVVVLAMEASRIMYFILELEALY